MEGGKLLRFIKTEKGNLDFGYVLHHYKPSYIPMTLLTRAPKKR